VRSDEDTIVALATAPGRAAVAIIRVSGAGASAVGAILGFPLPKPRVPAVRKLRQNDVELDQALILFFKGPGSYTGEDLVELQIHGGRAVYDSVVSALIETPGYRYAEPGEFTRRAVLAGRLDLTEAEAINDLVNAETEAQRDLAMMQLGGSLREVFDAWSAKLTAIRAHLEAYIDFPDEDIPDDVLEKLGGDLSELIQSMKDFSADGRRGERLRNGMRIAVVGPPNAGKSSFVNWLAERDVAIVSPKVGTTRDVVEVHLDLGGYPVTVADTAGLRDGGDVIEAEGMRRARAWAGDADLRVLVIEARNADLVDPEVFGALEGDLVLLNKIDLGESGDRQGSRVNGWPWRTQAMSLVSGAGLTEAMKWITDVARDRMEVSRRPVLSRSRHRAVLDASVCDLEVARRELALAREPEIVAEVMRQAADSLGRVTGRIDVEDLLDVVFRDFCIGK
jgi:tRNA modification GTPase